jgi:hypothetical protein
MAAPPGSAILVFAHDPPSTAAGIVQHIQSILEFTWSCGETGLKYGAGDPRVAKMSAYDRTRLFFPYKRTMDRLEGGGFFHDIELDRGTRIHVTEKPSERCFREYALVVGGERPSPENKEWIVEWAGRLRRGETSGCYCGFHRGGCFLDGSDVVYKPLEKIPELWAP